MVARHYGAMSWSRMVIGSKFETRRCSLWSRNNFRFEPPWWKRVRAAVERILMVCQYDGGLAGNSLGFSR